MRKNKTMRAASGLLVATLLTASVISGTFAKYTTSTSGNDTARVAYWGFDQNTTTTLDLFSDAYTNVKGAEKVVAPGTEDSTEFGFKYTGNTAKNINAPEVAYTLTIDAIASGSYNSLDSNPDFKWTLKSGKAGATETEYNTVADLLAAIKKLSGATDDSGTATYEAGKLPDAFGTAAANAKCTVGWKWLYEDTGKTDSQNTTDTAMGNAASLDSVTLTISIKATQVD